MMWGKARKRPVVVEFREPQPKPMKSGQVVEQIRTREGILFAYPGKDYVIKGVQGEIYPIGIDIFNETYDVVELIPRSSKPSVKEVE